MKIPGATLEDDIIAFDQVRTRKSNEVADKKLLSDAGRLQPASIRKSQLVEIAWELRAGVINGSVLIETQQPLSDQEIFPLRKERYLHVLRKESIDAWVMKPLVATTGMKEGSLNEEYVVKRSS